MKVGDRVREGDRSGTLLEVYELTDARGRRLGRKSARVQFDDDKIPTAGVRLDGLRTATDSEGTGT